MPMAVYEYIFCIKRESSAPKLKFWSSVAPCSCSCTKKRRPMTSSVLSGGKGHASQLQPFVYVTKVEAITWYSHICHMVFWESIGMISCIYLHLSALICIYLYPLSPWKSQLTLLCYPLLIESHFRSSGFRLQGLATKLHQSVGEFPRSEEPGNTSRLKSILSRTNLCYNLGRIVEKTADVIVWM